jgi:uncharacterized membrane protein YgdD (TMEM256/DUF423 family)
MDRFWITFAALAGAIGALGDAVVRHVITNPEQIEFGVTAARYGLIHALALLGVALLWNRDDYYAPGFWLSAAGWCFVAGQLLFSGSLYAFAFDIAPGWLGLLTKPGLAVLVLGWLALFLHALFARRQQ